MGQELSQALSPHAPELSPSSSQPPHTSSLIYDKTTISMSDIDMADDRYGSTTSPNGRSSTADLPAETVDTTDHRTDDNGIEQNTSDDINPLSDTFEQQLSYRRGLRPLREGKRFLPSTWVDADKTGDFDPHEEARQARARRKKAKLSQRKKFDWNAVEHTKQSDSNRRPAAKTIPAFRITFRTSSGKVAFAELSAKSERKAEQVCGISLAGHHLRKRGDTNDGRDTEGVYAAGVRVSASEAPLDLRNQPAGRGCLTCLAAAQRCSLLDNEHSWPCDDCKEAGDDCQLIQEPELKLACTHCEYMNKRQKWLVCSFEYSQDPSDHHGRCEQCRKDGHKNCVAGPRPGVTRTRLRIGPDGAPYTNQVCATQSRHQVKTCRQCLDSRRVCSFASQSQRGGEGICTACDMSGAACEPLGWKNPENQTDQQSSNSSACDTLGGGMELAFDVDDDFFAVSSSPPQKFISFASSRDSGFTPEPPAHSSGETGGIVKTVRTKFCHPMLFAYEDKTADGSDPCHFCSSAHFGLIGLEERTTQVIEWYDGRGWEEIGGGHRGDSVKGSQMCTACTTTRMQIMICEDHALRRIAEEGAELDHEAAFERLFDPELAKGDRWCSICCNLAVWECCLEQKAHEEQQVHPGEGCGLALCEVCVEGLETCGGSLETMLRDLEDKPSEARPAGLRADYELLKEDGLLMRYLEHEAARLEASSGQ